MAIGAVFAANMYSGLNTRSWTWWVFGGVIFGPVIMLFYTAIYAALPPSLIQSDFYGYNAFLWPAAYFWLGTLLTVVLSLLPRYLYRFMKENYFPSDVDVLGWVSKVDPKQCVLLCTFIFNFLTHTSTATGSTTLTCHGPQPSSTKSQERTTKRRARLSSRPRRACRPSDRTRTSSGE